MNATQTVGADWELDFYSRPILEAGGRKRWGLFVYLCKFFCFSPIFLEAQSVLYAL